MKTIEERAYEHYPIKRVGLPEEIAASEEGWEGYIKGATEQEAITKREMVEKAMVVFQSMSIKIINTTEGGEQWGTLKENYRKALEAEI